MPLITNYQQVKDTYREAAELGVALPAFCAEDRETLEAMLASVRDLGREIGVDDLPVIPAFTIHYPPRGQMTLIAACGDADLGLRLMLSDLALFTAPESPYGKLRVLPHLDHAFPWLDGEALEQAPGVFASVMFDASERPLEENVRLTAAYVERMAGRVLVEGAVDELFEAGSNGPKCELTTVEQARGFVRETGVDLIVPNVGTEHRATAGQAHYRGDRAREISAAVGRILCLHGSSSLAASDLPRLAEDGIIKVNIFTTLALHGGQAVARQVLGSLGEVLPPEELRELVALGVLGEQAVAPGQAVRLAAAANPPRRDAWFAAVRDRCGEFLRALGYHRYAR